MRATEEIEALLAKGDDYGAIDFIRRRLLSHDHKGREASRLRAELEQDLYELQDDLIADSTILCARCNEHHDADTAVRVGYHWVCPSCARDMAIRHDTSTAAPILEAA